MTNIPKVPPFVPGQVTIAIFSRVLQKHSVCPFHIVFWLLIFLQGGTLLGPPDSVVDLGNTEVTEEIFLEYLSSLGESMFR